MFVIILKFIGHPSRELNLDVFNGDGDDNNDLNVLPLAGSSSCFCREHRQRPRQPDSHPALLCQYARPHRPRKVCHGHQGGRVECRCVGKGGLPFWLCNSELIFHNSVIAADHLSFIYYYLNKFYSLFIIFVLIIFFKFTKLLHVSCLIIMQVDY